VEEPLPLVTINRYEELLDDRPVKFTEEEVGYGPAPEGSGFTCNSCRHYYRRGVDGFTVCEIMRSERTDVEGVLPDWRCIFQNTDGSVFHFLPSEDSDES
jgi:hypothetical protein